MKTRYLLLLFLAFCASFMMLNASVPASVPDNDDDDENFESLNDFRFANFSDADWFDNDYIRSLRQYLDDVAAGKVKDEELNPYIDIIKGKFVILDIGPAAGGGASIYIVFVEHPKDLFSEWVYSHANSETRTIGLYETRGVIHDEEPLDLTKEQILQIVKEHPELKLW